jgi:hypothetical protein
MIPAEAVNAALEANRSYPSTRSVDNAWKQMRATLEAAAPHMLNGLAASLGDATGEVIKLRAEVAYQKARAAYFKYAPEIDHDPEGVNELANEVLRLARVTGKPIGNTH